SNFVFGGGKLIVHGGSALRAANFLNDVFGLALQETNNPSGNTHRLTRDARWTSFEDAPGELADNLSISVLLRDTLPPNALSIYTNGPHSALVCFALGDGLIAFVGWDWNDAVPGGTQDGQWPTALTYTVWQNRHLPAPFFEEHPVNRTVATGGTAQFSVIARGLGPIFFQWRKDSAGIPGATNDFLIISNAQPADAGDYDVVVSNRFANRPSVPATLTVLPSVPLPIALNSTSLVWSTGGDAEWFGQTNTSHDGVASARSGTITHEEESWLETTVAGPGTLTFWWSISSEFTYDYLEFLTNGMPAERISGEVPWQFRTYSLGPETHVLLWRYHKDSSDHSGQDTAWLDEVTFVGAPGPFAARAARSATNIVLSWPVQPQKSYRVDFKNSLCESNWQTLTQQVVITNGIATAEDSLMWQPQRFYRIMEE
ncbi:MAG TPA: hypothetical protein VK846_13375, partial [Candidatus Limnocylindria bacterium]|nr:hypothetical protein [Candidatus Limnocylindria bacterium]